MKCESLLLLACLCFSGCQAQSLFEGITSFVANLVQPNRQEVDEWAPYTVVKTFDNEIELRSYPARNWVCTNKTVEPFSGSNGMFWKLFNYISVRKDNDPHELIVNVVKGTNVASQKIEMTAPVSTLMEPVKNQKEVMLHEMCFYLGAPVQNAPPAPTDPAVYIKPHAARKIYTRRQPGYMSDSDWQKEISDLASLLQTMGVSFDSARYYTAGYDSPMKLWNRRNEVWYTALGY